jgi:hypothetical protein
MLDPDPYHEPHGDYLYDQAKFVWYLQTTTNGSDAIPSDAFMRISRGQLEIETTQVRGDYEVRYNLRQPEWTAKALRTAEKNTEALANRFGDLHWEPRFELAQAATWLGLTRKAILRYCDRQCAVFLYVRGLKHLDKCVTEIGSP